MRTIRLALSIVVALALSGLPAHADEPYPGKTGHIIIAFGPGTGGDFLARLVAEQFSKQMKGKFVVDNRPGGGGSTGTKLAADAAPDGYTLLLGSNATLIINPTVNKETLYDGAKDFVPIGTVARTSMVLVTATSASGPKTLADLVSAAKSKTVTYASTGVGAFGHLTSEILLRQAGIKATNIPYKSSSESLTDVMRGEVLFAHDSVTAALPLIKSGRLRPLAVTGQERLQSLPDVPTYEEAGVKGMGITVWYCVMAPARTPKAIVDKLDTELTKMLANPEVLSRLKAVEFQPFPLEASRFGAFFSDELKFWQQFVAESRR